MTTQQLALRGHLGVMLRIMTQSRSILTLLVALALSLSAQAQYLVNLKMERSTYLAQEPILASVTMTNRSGADTIVGGRGKERWVSFEVTNPVGNAIPPLSANAEAPFVFKAGETITRQFYLTETHAFSDEGNYGVTALVYHAGSGQDFASNRARIGITDVKPLMEPITYGVPPGFDEAGRSREYHVIVFRDIERSYMYVRLVDAPTKSKLITLRLGAVSLHRDPQITLDSGNNLHVMYLTTPDTYGYYVIQPDGKIKSRELVKENEQTRPKLFLTASNDVVLRGGIPYDPNAAKAAAAEAKPRSISERPPGL
jgi:hypothetical protein